MRHYERVETGLNGQKADRIPIVPIYDYGYVMTSIGRDMRSYMTASAKERIEFIEESFLRHKMIDGLFVHAGCNDNWVNNNEVEKFENYWMITNKISGEKYRLLPDGCKADKEGNPFLRNLSNKGISRITSKYDIDRLLPAVPTEEAVEGSGQFWPLRHISQKYPGYHLSFQISTPMVRAINICGGFEEGLTTMAEDRNLFREIIERYTPLEEALIEPGKKAGGNSIWLTSYYTGADTISPKDYAELVFPYEKRICEKAKANGLKVLYWFLGDLMPVLKKVMEMPIDALVLEQEEKGMILTLLKSENMLAIVAVCLVLDMKQIFAITTSLD